MKKFIFIIGLFVSIIYASSKYDKSLYLEYTNQIINYNFQIKNINKIKTPFYKPRFYVKNLNNNINIFVKKRSKIILLAIFGNKAYIKVNNYIGEQLISSKKEWIKINKKIMGCKLVKLTDTDAYFKCNNKELHKTLNKKKLNVRDKK